MRMKQKNENWSSKKKDRVCIPFPPEDDNYICLLHADLLRDLFSISIDRTQVLKILSVKMISIQRIPTKSIFFGSSSFHRVAVDPIPDLRLLHTYPDIFIQ